MANLKRQQILDEMQRRWQVKVPPELHSLGVNRLIIMERYIQDIINQSVDGVWDQIMRQGG